MADVLPFAALRYNDREKAQIAQLGDLVAPPYDTLTEEMRKALHDRHPNNIVRITSGMKLPNDDEFTNRYTRAATTLQTWKDEEVLVPDKKRCLYGYEQEFVDPATNQKRTRRGFFAVVRLRTVHSGQIRPHEQTSVESKIDRLRLLRATLCNTSPIHCLYEDPERSVAQLLAEPFAAQPVEEVVDDTGTVHRLWAFSQKETILGVREAMKNKPLLIADGHNRYETALAYREEMREITGLRDNRQPFDYVLMLLSESDDENLAVLPIHRVLARELGSDIDLDEVLEDLEEYFELDEIELDFKDLPQAEALLARRIVPDKNALMRCAMVVPSAKAWILTLQKNADLDEMLDDDQIPPPVRRFDSTLLHHYVISQGWLGNPEIELEEGDIHHVHTIAAALDLLKRRKGCVAFLLNPTPMEQIRKAAELGYLLPPDTTFFSPKILSGLLLRDLNTGFE